MSFHFKLEFLAVLILVSHFQTYDMDIAMQWSVLISVVLTLTAIDEEYGGSFVRTKGLCR